MWKWVVGTVAITAIVAVVMTWQAKRCEAERDECQSATFTRPLGNPMIPIATAPDRNRDQEQAQNHASRACAHANAYLCRVLTTANLPTIYLVLIGIGGIVVATSTLRILDQQTIALNRSVLELRHQMTVCITQFAAENRPYVLLPSGDQKAQIGEPYLLPLASVPYSQQKRTHCMLTLRNYGKTPAKIIAEKFQLQIGGSAFVVPDVNVFEMAGATQDNFILPQTDSIYAEAELFPDKFITPEQKAEIDSKASFVWLCGFVRFRDTLGVEETTEYKPPEYETRFCMLWETTTNAPQPFWRPAGKKTYNNAT
jgi:hypothetical protein